MPLPDEKGGGAGMNSIVRESVERVTLEIQGYAPARDISYPEALRLLDAAYTEEIGQALARLGQLRRAAEAAMVQLSLALDGIKNLGRELEERHLRTGGGELEEKSEAD